MIIGGLWRLGKFLDDVDIFKDFAGNDGWMDGLSLEGFFVVDVVLVWMQIITIIMDIGNNVLRLSKCLWEL
jgi:hypothetical protein